MALSQQGWLRRRIISPIIEQLKQGNNPDQIALSLAVGITLACFPVIGVTTLFCLMAGVIFKLNHPTLQLANHSSALLQLALIIPFCRLGERLLGATGAAQSPVILALFKSDLRRPPGLIAWQDCAARRPGASLRPSLGICFIRC